jgi:DNA polymerase-3 subunit beta
MTIDISIPRNDLSKMLSRASSAVAHKSPQAVMQCALIEAADGALTVSGTDSFVSIRSTSNATVKKPGRICVDARKAADVVKNLPAGDVRVLVKDGAAFFSSAKSKTKLATVDAEAFPPLPTTSNATLIAKIDCDVLSRLIAQGTYAQATDDTRAFLCVGLLDIADDSATMVSTDGNRLALAVTKMAHGPATKIAIPARGLGELKRLCESLKGGTVELYKHGAMMLVSSSDATLSIQLGDESQFPPYQRIIPKSFAHRVTFSRDMLMDALKRASLVAAAVKAGRVRLEFSDGELAILAESEADSADERIECDATFALTIGVGSTFLSQALVTLMTDEVTLDLGGDLDPIVVRGVSDDSAYSVVMPMRIANV